MQETLQRRTSNLQDDVHQIMSKSNFIYPPAKVIQFTNLTSAAYIYFKKKIGINDEVTARNVDVAKEIFRSDASIANEIPVSDSMREDMLIVVELFAARL